MSRGHLQLLFALATACTCVHAQTQTQMRTVMPGTTLSSTLLGRGAPTPASARSLEVFASSAMYLTNTEGATVHRVDGRAQVLAAVNQGGLPPDPNKAMAIAQERIRLMGPEFQQRMREDLRTTEKVVVYGIQRVPAVVVDGKRIVYGVTDVRKAVEIAAAGGGEPLQMRMVPGNPELVRK
jgi:integrating conjugative element protein (TIGR03757 family)